MPAEPSVPARLYSAAPSMRIGSTLSSVSTLLTHGGLPNRPDSTGKGGLLRGSLRRPSIELKSAVSSPQMYAPAPRRSSMSKRTPLPRMSPSRPRLRAAAIARASALGRERVFAADVQKALLRAGREARDRHRLDQRERIVLHEHAVLERPRLGLVGVAHQVVRAPRGARDRVPLAASRERRAAAAHEPRLGDLAGHAGGPIASARRSAS